MDPLAQQLDPYNSLYPNKPVTRTNLIGASALTPPAINRIGGPGMTPAPQEDPRKKQQNKWGALAAMLVASQGMGVNLGPLSGMMGSLGGML